MREKKKQRLVSNPDLEQLNGVPRWRTSGKKRPRAIGRDPAAGSSSKQPRDQKAWELLPFRKMKFSSRLFFEQNDQKLVGSLKAKFGHDAVLVFGDWSAPNTKHQETTRNKGLISMLKKNGFSVYLINEYKTSSHCPACESELEKFKNVPNPRPYKGTKNPAIVCNGLLRQFKDN